MNRSHKPTISLIFLKGKCYTLGRKSVRGEKMTKEEFENQLNALVEGSQKELYVKKEEYLIFLEAWNEHPQKKSFTGEALLGGNVVYHYNKEENN